MAKRLSNYKRKIVVGDATLKHQQRRKSKIVVGDATLNTNNGGTDKNMDAFNKAVYNKSSLSSLRKLGITYDTKSISDFYEKYGNKYDATEIDTHINNEDITYKILKNPFFAFVGV